ncbi:MAG: hypothetical protein WAQ98_12700 [Blastocatellia bacterium]
MTTYFRLLNKTGLDLTVARTWVAAWINGGSNSFKVLGQNGIFQPVTGTNPEVPFLDIDQIPNSTVYLSDPTNGNDRFIFVVSLEQPSPLQVAGNLPVEFTAYPYTVPPGVASPGPYDIFEFGLDAQDDLSAVNGFGLNLSFGVDGNSQQYGANPNFARRQIGQAFKMFIKNEEGGLPSASAFAELLYDAPISSSAPAPPMVDNQFFGICDPNDMLAAKTANYTKSSGDPLEKFWDDTLAAFFTNGLYLSINLGGGNIYSGQCANNTYTLSNGTNTYNFSKPSSSLSSAQYVFQQSFSKTPAADQGLLQDNIWEALCRGVACGGTSTKSITNGETTQYWNNPANWYEVGTVCHLYAKFLHYSTIDGTDSRQGGTPIFYNNAAYGFSMDENPDGPYSGPNVPSKTPTNVPDGSTVTITIGAWEKVQPNESNGQTIMMLTQGSNPGFVVTEYLEKQMEANGGKFVMKFCSLPKDLRPTKLEFRYINEIPTRKIIMNFSQGCPNSSLNVTEYISNQIEANNGNFIMTFPINAPPEIQLNSIEFQFES